MICKCDHDEDVHRLIISDSDPKMVEESGSCTVPGCGCMEYREREPALRPEDMSPTRTVGIIPTPEVLDRIANALERIAAVLEAKAK